MDIVKGAKRLVARRWEELGWEGKSPSPSKETPRRGRRAIRL